MLQNVSLLSNFRVCVLLKSVVIIILKLDFIGNYNHIDVNQFIIDADFSSFSLAESSLRDLQITAYK